MPEQIREGTRTARKLHNCGMCNGKIQPGERHHVSTNVYDGRAYDFRTCQPCEADGIVAAVYEWAGWPDHGVAYGEALEWAEDYQHTNDRAKRLLERLLERSRGDNVEDTP